MNKIYIINQSRSDQFVLFTLPRSFKSVGVESQLVAAATFKMVKKGDDTARKEKEKVIQLTLLAVRKRFRKIGIGRQLLNVSRRNHCHSY